MKFKSGQFWGDRYLRPAPYVSQASQNDDPLLTTAEVAKQLKRSVDTIRNWVNAGRIPHHQIGGTTFFRMSEILAATRRA